MKPAHDTPPGNPGPFANELRDLPPAVAAELEDHLMESYAAGLRSGLDAAEARQAALRSLGHPDLVGRACQAATAGAAGAGWGFRAAAAGWFLLGAGFATRVCQAADPTPVSLGCLAGLTCASLVMAVGLRHASGWAAWLMVAGSWGLGLGAGLGLSRTTWHGWIQEGMGLSPSMLGTLFLFGLASGGLLAVARWKILQRQAPLAS